MKVGGKEKIEYLIYMVHTRIAYYRTNTKNTHVSIIVQKDQQCLTLMYNN